VRFPYLERRPGTFRPHVAVVVRSPHKTALADGLLDTGADRTVLTPKIATRLGLDFDALPGQYVIQSATGHDVQCKLVQLVLELRRDGQAVSWAADVAVTKAPLQSALWGMKGFLEFFRAEFDGPGRAVTLTPGLNFPAASGSP
jgi:hypothetical protein